MENTQAQGQKMNVTIEEVNKETNEIYINDGNGNEGFFQVIAPASINYCKVGPASITLKNGFITYCRNESSGQPNNSGYKKPYQSQYSKPAYTPYPKKEYTPRPFTQGNEYKPKEECYYEETELLFERVGFIESGKIVEDLKKRKWVFYVQRLPRYGDFLESKEEGEDKMIHYTYDVAIGIREKRLGKRPEGTQEEYI